MITTWSSGTPDKNMDEEILVGLSDIVSRHPWWAARTDLVIALLEGLRIGPPASVLEIGCGWGTNLEALEGVQALFGSTSMACSLGHEDHVPH